MAKTTLDHRKRWIIVVVAMLSLVISNGLSIGGLPPFYKPIREEFVGLGAIDASYAESFIANAANITFLASGFFSVLGGWLVTRVRLKFLMIIGCVLLGGGLVLHAETASASGVYLARLLMGASLGFVGVAPCVVLVTEWFETNRGFALGIALTGTSLGGTLIPLIASPLISAYGWRNAMLGISVLVWIVLLPMVLLFVHERGDEKSVERAGERDGMSFTRVLRTPVFWLLTVSAALIFYPIFVTSQQFILYLQTPKIGVSAENAALAQSGLWAMSLAGKFAAGFASDRLGPTRVMTACAGLLFAASLVLLHLTAGDALLFLLPFGFGYGGTFVIIQRLAAELFGRRDAGKIVGMITLTDVIGAAVGGRITGYLADRAGGDYTVAFYGVTIAAGLAFVGALLLLTLARDRTYHQKHAL